MLLGFPFTFPQALDARGASEQLQAVAAWTGVHLNLQPLQMLKSPRAFNAALYDFQPNRCHAAFSAGRPSEEVELQSGLCTLLSRAAKTKMPHKKTCEAFYKLGWLMGLEPTTTGITILDSTN